jgi:hypothetical protein
MTKLITYVSLDRYLVLGYQPFPQKKKKRQVAPFTCMVSKMMSGVPSSGLWCNGNYMVVEPVDRMLLLWYLQLV